MQEALNAIEQGSIKKKISDIRVGDTVRVHQRIKEGKDDFHNLVL
jgi:ribosomal protein L19